VRRRGSWFWPALGGSVAASAALLAATHDPIVRPSTQVTVAAIACIGWASSCGVAWSRYRSSNDPHLLFVSTGCAALAVGVLLYGIAFSIAIELPQGLLGQATDVPAVRLVSPLPVVGWFVTWLVAGGCFLAALPWRDRRGKPPVRPATVCGYVAIATGASMVVAYFLAEALQNGATWRGVDLGLSGADRYGLGVAGWLLGGAVVGLLALTAFREAAHDPSFRTAHPWLAVAFLVATPMAISVIHRPLQGTGLLSWSDALQPLAPAIVLAGLIVSQHDEVSRVRRATDRAAEVLGGRAEIASTLAHDLRSPVASVKSLAATTSQSYERLSDAERVEFVRLIEQEAGRLLDTINQASLALKVDAGSLVHDKRSIDLATVIRDGIELADTGAHDLSTDLIPGLTVVADRHHLAEAVRQVVENAAKFSADDAPIRVTSSTQDDHAVIEVTDEGPGIPSERRGEVFDRFARWRPKGYEDRPGPGLGLFISRGILAEHEGDMVIDEAPGGGTILRILLPVGG
jgi:signal transduction histidine kinase